MRNLEKYFWSCVLAIGLIGCHYREAPRTLDRSNLSATELLETDTIEITELEEKLEMEEENKDTFSEEKYMEAPWLTRDMLADILNHHFKHVFPPDRKPPVIVDLDQSSNHEAVLSSAAAGLIPVGRDHRILPGSRVRKQDITLAVWRVLELAGALPDQSLLDTSLLPYDITPSHNAWKQIAGCLFTGIVTIDTDNLYHPGRIMSGKEILDSIDALKRYLKRYGK